MVGRGRTAVAWKATSRGECYAIKFALRSDYSTHSIDAEVRQIQSVDSSLLARIEFYGTPQSELADIAWADLYAIVVEWIDGVSFKKYVESAREIDDQSFVKIARDFFVLAKAFSDQGLQHNDLHNENVLVRTKRDPLTESETVQIVAIDSGQLKTDVRRIELIETQSSQLSTLESLIESSPEIESRKSTLRESIRLFGRTDHEWIVKHLCDLANAKLATLDRSRAGTGTEIDKLLGVFQLAVDPDHSRRLDDPLQLFQAIEKALSEPDSSESKMTNPFDFPSAELIRSDQQLMKLFSNDYPRLDTCRSDAPTYIYGPRGCGKSTLLRSLALTAALDSDDVETALSQTSFFGVYISCSSELRSRFWLFDESDFEDLKAHIVRYFGLLLIEQLVNTIRSMREVSERHSFGITQEVERKACKVIRDRVGIPVETTPYSSVNPTAHLATEIRQERDRLWRRILDLETPSERVDAQLVFDVCNKLEDVCSIFKTRKIAFLLDDYSNQRIPAELQKKLNQAITFSKQGSPIFKVSSEYFGVELEGIHEGREVQEVNVGAEYVQLTGKRRWSFLKELLEKRFGHLDIDVKIEEILGESKIKPALDMAKKIKASVRGDGEKFWYHGIDTLSDVCSGDFAMGLDLVRKIFESSKTSWKTPKAIPPKDQHKVITEYGAREFEYIRYRWLEGAKKYHIIDRLCWLARQCVLEKARMKSGIEEPYLKNHLDISEAAIQELEEHSPKEAQILNELIRKGVLFPLQTSMSRESHSGTRRYMVRRILLTRYVVPLGRDVAIKIDNLERLRTLLTDAKLFVETELAATGRQKKQVVEKKPPEEIQTSFIEDSDADDSSS